MGWTYGGESIAESTIQKIEVSEIGNAELWLLGLLFFGVGDLLTTGIGLGISGVSEGDPLVASTMLENGLFAFGAMKLLTLVGFLLVWWLVPGPERIAIPLALSVVGIAVTLWNVHVLILSTTASLGFI